MPRSCIWSTSRTSTALDTDDTKYPVKKTTISDPTASSELTSGNIGIRANGPVSAQPICRTPQSPNAFSAKVMGSPSARRTTTRTSPVGVEHRPQGRTGRRLGRRRDHPAGMDLADELADGAK